MDKITEIDVLEPEMAFIGSLLLNGDQVTTIPQLEVGDFMSGGHAAIYMAIWNLSLEGIVVDPVTVSRFFQVFDEEYKDLVKETVGQDLVTIPKLSREYLELCALSTPDANGARKYRAIMGARKWIYDEERAMH